jgi:hypothetical protein
MPEHREPSPAAMAHGRAKSTDIERVRRDVEKAEAKVAREVQASAAERLADRESGPKPETQP